MVSLIFKRCSIFQSIEDKMTMERFDLLVFVKETFEIGIWKFDKIPNFQGYLEFGISR